MRLFPSLKSRYASVSLLLIIMVIASATAGYRIVTSSQHKASVNEAYRSDMQEASRLLRNSIWSSRVYLEEFLLEPGVEDLPGKIRDKLAQANVHTQNLLSKTPSENTELRATLQKIQENSSELARYIDNVIDTRLDAPKQYPTVAIGRDEMQPNQSVFFAAANRAMKEIIDEDPAGYQLEMYQEFEKARQLWGRLISNFRMYLANRLGSFSEDVLPIQEKDSELMISEIKLTLAEIQAYEDEGRLGFVGAESLIIMNEAFQSWVEGFYRVLEIHQSGAWRTDKILLVSHINPLYLDLWNSLQAFDNIFRDLALKDINYLSEISNMQLKMIWATTVIALLIISFGYLSLDRSILKPIAQLTKALREVSEGKQHGPLPTANARETENLLHAFKKMQQQIHARENDLKHLAMHDELTGLPNRNLMKERLEHVIAISKREHRHPALLMMDLDGFKQVNDTLGHQMGDKLLVAIGKRLLNLLRETDTIVRLGGDEFAVLIDNVEKDYAIEVSKRILNLIQKPFLIENNQLYVSASIGIAHYPYHGDSCNLLIQHADVAMYHAKRNKLGVMVYDPAIDENKVHKLSLISDLRQALQENGLQVYFQPKVAACSQKSHSAEVLLRWLHPQDGFIPPDQIITLAEQSGLINHVFEWVFEQAAIHVRHWLDLGLDINTSINLSVYDFQHHDIVSVIQHILEKYDLSPTCFTLEVTESAMMENPENAVQKLYAIDAMGIRLSIDDFGTGYSSLSYLKQLPVDELKIDKSFVMQMDEDKNDEIIVKSTIDLAHNLGLHVVAEGVENQKISDLLNKFGCDTLQGFYYARPMPPSEFEDWVKNNNLKFNNPQIKSA